MQKVQQAEELLPREQKPPVPKSLIDLPHLVVIFVVALAVTIYHNGF